MSTNVTHEKPETEEQPTVKKLRIDEDASSVDSMTSAEDKTDATTDTLNEDKTLTVEAATAQQPQSTTTTSVATPKAAATPPKPATTGFSAFSGGGFSAFSSGGGFAGFAKPAESTSSSSSSSFSSGFGAFASSNTSSGFSGFAKTAESSGGFGAFARADDSAEGFAETASGDADPNDEEATTEFTPVVTLTEAEVANGEEEERVVVEKRAKLFKLVGNDYSEVGVGPFRVLKQKDAQDIEQTRATARMVMRRESYARGPGTKLILNARLSAFLSSVVKSEKSLMVVILEPEVGPASDKDTSRGNAQPKIKPVTYLIRFATNEDLVVVQEHVTELLPVRETSS